MGIRKEGGSGQPCLWWSQGCSIGCDFCITDPRHKANGGAIPTREITGGWPHADKAGFRTAYCDEPAQPVLPKKFWTMNRHAVEGAVNDSYRFNPWRAPGTAPVVDPCGQAGGKYAITPMGGDSVFYNTSIARMGDLGSKVLPATPASHTPTWVAGSHVDVAWGMRFNHGGGAPRPRPLARPPLPPCPTRPLPPRPPPCGLVRPRPSICHAPAPFDRHLLPPPCVGPM